MFTTHPTKSSPVNPEEQRGQTGPGLKTQATGLVSKTFPGKGGNGFKLADTSDNSAGTRTYPKKGAKMSRPGEDVTNDVPGDITQKNGGNCCGDLMAKPKAV
jgi:hypothetical protein